MTLMGTKIGSGQMTGGIAGVRGLTGTGIAAITENPDYTITITLTNGSAYTTSPIPGYTAIAFDSDYNLVVTKTDGTTETVNTPLKSYMTTAYGYKEDAETAATNAGTSETNAGNSATSANTNALKAEGYAVGKQNDVDVETGSAYFHNNAKYYAEAAQQAAGESGYAIFHIDEDDGNMYVTITDNLADDVVFSVNTSNGTLEVLENE